MRVALTTTVATLIFIVITFTTTTVNAHSGSSNGNGNGNGPPAPGAAACDSSRTLTPCGNCVLTPEPTLDNICAVGCHNSAPPATPIYFRDDCGTCVFEGALNTDGHWNSCYQQEEILVLDLDGVTESCCEERSAIVSAQSTSNTELRICVHARDNATVAAPLWAVMFANRNKTDNTTVVQYACPFGTTTDATWEATPGDIGAGISASICRVYLLSELSEIGNVDVVTTTTPGANGLNQTTMTITMVIEVQLLANETDCETVAMAPFLSNLSPVLCHTVLTVVAERVGGDMVDPCVQQASCSLMTEDIEFPACSLPVDSGFYTVMISSDVCVLVDPSCPTPPLFAFTPEDIVLRSVPPIPFSAVTPALVPEEHYDQHTGQCAPWNNCPVDRMNDDPPHVQNHGFYTCDRPHPEGGCVRWYYQQHDDEYYHNDAHFYPNITVACRLVDGRYCCRQWWRVVVQPPVQFVAPAVIDLHVEFPFAPVDGCLVGQLQNVSSESSCRRVIRLRAGDVQETDIQAVTLERTTVLAYYDRPATDPGAMEVDLGARPVLEGTLVWFAAVDSESRQLVPHLNLESYTLQCDGSGPDPFGWVIHDLYPLSLAIDWYQFYLNPSPIMPLSSPPGGGKISGSHLLSGAVCGGDLEDGMARHVSIHAVWTLSDIPESTANQRRLLSDRSRTHTHTYEHGYGVFSSHCTVGACNRDRIFHYRGGSVSVTNAVTVLLVIFGFLALGCCMLVCVDSVVSRNASGACAIPDQQQHGQRTRQRVRRSMRGDVEEGEANGATIVDFDKTTTNNNNNNNTDWQEARLRSHAHQDAGENKSTSLAGGGRTVNNIYINAGDLQARQSASMQKRTPMCTPAGLMPIRPSQQQHTYRMGQMITHNPQGGWNSEGMQMTQQEIVQLLVDGID
jgi:hypothetical protein